MTIRLWYSKKPTREWLYDHGPGSNVVHTVKQVIVENATGYTSVTEDNPDFKHASAWIEFPDVSAFRTGELLEIRGKHDA